MYGLGGIVSRVIAVFLLPVYTRYLAPEAFGAVGLLVALSAVLVTILRAGISSAFFRFTFDSKDPERRLLVLRTSFWFTMASATFGLAAGVILAEPIADVLGLDRPLARPRRVRRHLGPDELRAADGRVPGRGALDPLRVREPRQRRRDGRATLLLIVVWDQGALGLIVGNFLGTLDRLPRAARPSARPARPLRSHEPLLREMNRFGIPLVPARRR